MLKSPTPKHLIWTFLAIAIVLTVSALWSERATAEQIPLDNLNATENKPEEIPELKEALQRLQSRDVAGAKRILDKAVEAHPKLPPSEMIMAQFFAAAQQVQGVRHWLQMAVIEHPESPDAYVMLGQLDAQSGLQVEAWLLLEKANIVLAADTKLDPDRRKTLQAAIYGQLAQLAMARKAWDEAKGYLQKLLNEQPSQPGALQLLARVLFEEGDAKGALEKLQAAEAAAKAEKKDFLTPQATMAQWYETKDDHNNAYKMMQEALTIAPTDFDTRIAAAQWAFVSQNFDQAAKQAQAALKLDPESVKALLLAGSIAIFQKDYTTAEKYLDEAATREPMNFAASNNLAIALCEQDDPRKLTRAQGLAQLNVNSHPKEVEALSTLGRVLYKSGRLQDAEKSLRGAVSLGKPVGPDTAYYMAVIYADANNKDAAKKLLQNALKAKGLFAQRAEAEALLQRLSQ